MSENFAADAESTFTDCCTADAANRSRTVGIAAAVFARYRIFTAALFPKLPLSFEIVRTQLWPSPAGPASDRCYPGDSAGSDCADRGSRPIPPVSAPRRADSDSGKRCQ